MPRNGTLISQVAICSTTDAILDVYTGYALKTVSYEQRSSYEMWKYPMNTETHIFHRY